MSNSNFNRARRWSLSGALIFGALFCLVDASPVRAELIYGVTQQQFLVNWDSATPGSLASGTAISGLQQNEQVLGIDFRPATGQLYALGSFNRLYTLDVATGAANLVGAGPFAIPISGSSHGFDFNPTIDRIRVVTDTNDNYVLNPNSGTVQLQATDVAYAVGDINEGVDANIVHSSYTNSFPGATTTQLYGIDTGLDILATQANNAGTLATVGSVGTNITDVGGFDISGATGIAYLAIKDATSSKSTFWTINLTTGAGTGGSEIGGGSVITALAVAPVPEPTTGLLLSVSACLIGTRRKR